MKKMFADNQWGFDINSTNPFWISLYNLREVAKEHVGEDGVLDLSRGDPGYGFSPNVRSRQFYAYLVFLDTILNNFETHLVYDRRSYEELLQDITEKTRAFYSAETAEHHLRELDLFIEELKRITKAQNLNYSDRDILFQIFKYATVSGGCYHDPQGEEICRAVIADYYSKQFNEKIAAADLVFMRGVSDGIGTFFQLMDNKEGIGYLKEGDTVVSASPAYAPYNMIFKHRGLNVLSVSFNPATGEVDKESLEQIKNFNGQIKVFSLIDPNNPTGFSVPEDFKRELIKIAEEHNAIILTDEVYSSFLAGTGTIYSLAPRRTLRIDARSKIERSTGLRFGDILIPEETNKYISENILTEYLPKDNDLKRALILAKAPGGTKGEFMHTTFVSGPSQFMGICHVLFGAEERKRYVEMVQKNVQEFAQILEIENEGNTYYTLFDLNDLASETKKSLPAEEKFYELAKRGVVLIPANLFFSEKERLHKDVKSTARACLPNLTFENIQKSARIIKEYMGS
jgi:aspartate/methionine/tyrosine aminotransferase